MSHNSEIQTELDNQNYLTKALDELGFTYQQGDLRAKSRYGVNESVDVLVTGHKSKKFQHGIGFKKQSDGKYKAVGDYYNLKTEDGRYVNEVFMKNEVTAASKEIEIRERLKKLGFKTSRGSKKREGNTVKFKLERWST